MRMENSSIKLLAIYVTLITVSAVLILLGIFWLTALGCALISLAEFFSSRRNTRKGWSFIYLAFVAILILGMDMSDGYAFKQDRRSLLYWIVVAVGWLCFIIVEYYNFRKSRSASQILSK